MITNYAVEYAEKYPECYEPKDIPKNLEAWGAKAVGWLLDLARLSGDIEAREVLLQIIAKAYPVFEALRAEHKEGRTAKRSCSAKHPRKR